VNLLAWFEQHRTRYPWRLDRDPYRVLVSEVMLQQTQAPRVVPAYESFLATFPTVQSLAASSRADVLRAWGSLGYNRRAVALHDAARVVVDRHAGEIPREMEELVTLPGIGPYTAAAVASIAFGEIVVAIDTNVARVVSRARLGTDGASKADVAQAAVTWIDREDPGAWNQAVMDLGRDVCRAAPRCEECPLRRSCRFRRTGGVVARSGSRQSPFRGSFRQVRGAVVRELRTRGEATVTELSSVSGHPLDRVESAVRALAADGLVETAAAGSGEQVVRLPS
jgi:A/G-specific adenine glycosylase